jgi:hypothetical protein
MTQEDPSDLYLQTIELLVETDKRLYLLDAKNNILVASWKWLGKDDLDMDSFQSNALILVDLLLKYNPAYVMIDCRKLGFEMTDQGHRWYVQQTKHIWAKTKPKKIAFIFKENLAAQAAMEGLKDVAIEEEAVILKYRIFESNIDALNWLSAK